MTHDFDARARRPKGHGDAVDLGTCEGSPDCILASPSNPFGDNLKSEILRCRVTKAEYALLKARAENSQTSMAELMRNALGLVEAKRPRPTPKADPQLIRQIAGIGNNLNQIAHRLNRDAVMGFMLPMDALALASELVTIERQLSRILEAHQNAD